ncbi:MAG: WD40/YVTN/BNR-like repeat-containing protein [Thermoplasmatota archaeon]
MAMKLLALSAALLLFLAGCSQSPDEPAFEILHVHGLAYDANATTLYVATHHGLAQGANKGKTWQSVGDMFDYMGFTQDSVKNGTFYSSGHPDDPRAFGGVHLGLRRSTDGGATWEQRSLKGQVDFHSIAAVPSVEGGLVGLWKDKLMESRDGGLTWTNHTGPALLMFDVAVTSHHTYVATADGLAGGHLGNQSSWQRFSDPEPGRIAMALAASPDGSVMFAGTGNGRSGATYRSVDGADTWQKVEQPLLASTAVPALFAFDSSNAQHVYAATSAGDILESQDAGESWTSLRRSD